MITAIFCALATDLDAALIASGMLPFLRIVAVVVVAIGGLAYFALFARDDH